MVHNAGRLCTMHVNGAQRCSVPRSGHKVASTNTDGWKDGPKRIIALLCGQDSRRSHKTLDICLSITMQHSQLNKEMTRNSRICGHM